MFRSLSRVSNVVRSSSRICRVAIVPRLSAQLTSCTRPSFATSAAAATSATASNSAASKPRSSADLLKFQKKPPRKVAGAHGQLVNTLLEVLSSAEAKESGVLIRVASELEQVAHHAKTNTDFRLLFEDKSKDTKEKLEAFGVSKWGAHNTTIEAIRYIIDNKLVNQLDAIARDFHQSVVDHLGLVSASVTSAEELTAEQKAAAEKSLKNTVGGGFQVHIKYVVDPSIIGGLRILLDDKFVDFSVATSISAKHQMYSRPDRYA